MEPTGATWLALLVIGGFIWGGFTVALVTAVRKESRKGTPEAPARD
jgi:LPS O-antigen subunit length determinant protein (WzzB/FepE family)